MTTLISAPMSLDLFSIPPFILSSDMYIFLAVIVDTISINADVTEEDGLFVIFAMITSKSQRKRPRKDFSFIPDIVRLTVIVRISDVPIVFEIIICTLHTTLNFILFSIKINYNVPISVVVDVVGISDASPIVVLNRIMIIIYATKMSKMCFPVT